MEYKQIKIKDVKKADYNPRKISSDEKEKLKESLKTFGCVRPLVINKGSGRLISGHQMLDAAEELGWTELPYIEIELDEKKEKVLNILMNKVGGTWDYDRLNGILTELNSLGGDYFKLSGFEENELDAIAQMNNVDDLPSDEVLEMDEVGQRFPLTFYFDSEKDRDNIKQTFLNENLSWKLKGEPNTFQLKKLLKDVNKK